MVTGRATSPNGTGPSAVGAIADHAWRAEALVAAALAEPMARARALVAGVATAGCLVGPDGRTVTVGRWADFAV
jgi:hypothetical protein